MTKFLLPIALATLYLLLAHPLYLSAGTMQWKVNRSPYNANPRVQSGELVSLYNLDEKDYMAYGDRTFGINLNWYTNPKYSFQLTNASGLHGYLKYGDVIALHEKKGGYIVYGDRTYGIALVWTSRPTLQWKICGKRPGTELRIGDPFALLNTRTNDTLVYCQRTFGINLRWYKDCDTYDQPQLVSTTYTATYLLKKQDIISGYVPYLFEFGPFYPGTTKVSKIEFPQSGFLVRRGHSTTECGNLNAVVPVFGVMSDSAKKAVWGTSTVVLGAQEKLIFLGCSPQTFNYFPVKITFTRTYSQ